MAHHGDVGGLSGGMGGLRMGEANFFPSTLIPPKLVLSTKCSGFQPLSDLSWLATVYCCHKL